MVYVTQGELAAPAGADMVGFVALVPSAQTRTLLGKGRDTISVKDFGAIGDGESHMLSERYATLANAQIDYPFVSSLSQEIDWAACQAALNAFPAGSFVSPSQVDEAGLSIDFPRGIYMIGDDTLKLTSNHNNGYINGVSVIGDKAVIKGGARCTKIFSVETDYHDKVVCDVEISNLQFDMTDVDAPGAIGLYLKNCAASRFSKLTFFSGDGTETHVKMAGTGSNVNFTDCHASRWEIAGDDYGVNQFLWTTVSFTKCSASSFKISKAWLITFQACVIQDPEFSAFILSDCRNISIRDCDIESKFGSTFIDCSNSGQFGVSGIVTENNSWQSMLEYIVGFASSSDFRDRYGYTRGRVSASGIINISSSTEIYSFAGDPVNSFGTSLTYAVFHVWADNGNVGVYQQWIYMGNTLNQFGTTMITYGSAPPSVSLSFDGQRSVQASSSSPMNMKVVVVSSPFS